MRGLPQDGAGALYLVRGAAGQSGQTVQRGGRLAQTAAQTRKGRLLVVAVKQSAGNMVFNPGAEVVAGSGDTIILMGKRADIALWNTARPGDLAYPLGFNPLAAVIHHGELVRGIL